MKTWHIVLFFGAILLAAYFGVIVIPGITPTTPVGPGQTPLPSAPPGVQYEAANIKWSIANILTGTDSGSGSTSYVDISKVVNGVFDPLRTDEATEYDASPDTSTLSYNYGEELVIHVASDLDATGGYEMYDSFFSCKLVPGSAIKRLSIDDFQVVQTSPTYKYKVVGGDDTGDDVQYLGGTTPYWGLGALKLYPRVAKDYVIQQLRQGGTVMATLNDGAGWIDTQGEQSADVTLATDSETMYVDIIAEATDVCYAQPQLVIQQSGRIDEYRAVAVIATNATGIGVTALANAGWIPVNKVDLTADMAFYKILDPATFTPARGQKFDVAIQVPIDASALAASTAFSMMAWIADIQSPSNVAIGTISTSLPTAYGMIKEFGCDSIVEPLALTVSTGSAATPQLYGDWTTAS